MKMRLRNGKLIEVQDGQERTLKILYGTTLGRILLKPLTKPWISKVAGSFLSTKASCIFIKPFIKKNNIDMSQFVDEQYTSYNAFFSRKIRQGARTLDMNPNHLMSPCDCKLTALKIRMDRRFTLKQTEYTVASLLKNKELAKQYDGGYALIFRLTVDDYHRYCYVESERFI